MMSQRLQETKNRLCAPNPCRVLLMAELKIHQFHPRIDHQLAQHGTELAEMQQIQIEVLEERLNERSG